MTEKLAILDCGGQYTKVIDRKVRELGVYTDIYPLGADPASLIGYGGIILSGGPASVWAKGAPSYSAKIFDTGVPILGICYGMQLICEHFGGVVKPGVKTEYGQTLIDITPSCPLFDSLSEREYVLMSHGDAVEALPRGFECVARTEGVVAGVYSEKLRIAGVQFHPEVDPTVNGLKMLENFLRKICAFTERYEPLDRVRSSVEMIRSRVGDKNVMVLVSGGVDSAVTAALLLKALPPERVYAIHVDHGLMRMNESDEICDGLKQLGLKNLLRVNAEQSFFNTELDTEDGKLAPLCRQTDPELKRSIIGTMFVHVTRQASKQLGLDFDNTFLAQGTLRPDLIESGNPDVSGYANKIKTHHNDVDIIREARERGMIIETNWDWHKDEVRAVARSLGLPEAVASRQPFPGPGLGIRMLCSDGGVKCDPADDAELASFVDGCGVAVSARTAPVNSVGVQGDNRSYKRLALLYGADALKNTEELFRIGRDIPNNLPFVNRVAYVLNRTSPGEMNSNSLYICRENSDLLRKIDKLVTDRLLRPGISQCLAVLLPFGAENKYSVAVRAVVTSDFMTARSAIPGVDFPTELLSEITNEISSYPQIDLIMYDITAKPPATVEWE